VVSFDFWISDAQNFFGGGERAAEPQLSGATTLRFCTVIHSKHVWRRQRSLLTPQNICDASGLSVRPGLSGETVNIFWGRVLVYMSLLHGCNVVRRPISSITSFDKIRTLVYTRLIYMKHRRRGSSVSIVIHLRFHSSREQKLLSSWLRADRFWDCVFACVECRWPCLRGAKAWNWPLSLSIGGIPLSLIRRNIVMLK
jgi:hypothetical protein